MLRNHCDFGSELDIFEELKDNHCAVRIYLCYYIVNKVNKD